MFNILEKKKPFADKTKPFSQLPSQVLGYTLQQFQQYQEPLTRDHSDPLRASQWKASSVQGQSAQHQS